jgi:hypothetical protein
MYRSCMNQYLIYSMFKLCAMLLYDYIRDLSAPLCLKYYLVLKSFEILPGWRMVEPNLPPRFNARKVARTRPFIT